MAGTITAIGSIWEALCAPVVGYLSDNTLSRFGKRKPFLIAAAFPVAIVTSLMFTTIDAGPAFKAIYYTGMIIFFWTAFSTEFISYMAWGSDLTDDYDERTVLRSYAYVFNQVGMCIGMVLPTMITGIVDRFIPLGSFKAVMEGAVKLAIFFFYMWGVTFVEDVKRLFMYHGAEHKTIACYEAGEELIVENVRRHSRFHPRCGTSFLFIVVIVSIIIFSFVPWTSTMGRVGLKLLLLPVVVGIAYEILKFTGRHENRCTKLLASPGMFFQKFTTKEPDDDMIEVAIEAMKAVIPQSREEDKW